MEYLERVKTVHSKGGYGSQGYRYDWKLEEAQKNLLRTHTTAVTARMLYKLMQEVYSEQILIAPLRTMNHENKYFAGRV